MQARNGIYREGPASDEESDGATDQLTQNPTPAILAPARSQLERHTVSKPSSFQKVIWPENAENW